MENIEKSSKTENMETINDSIHKELSEEEKIELQKMGDEYFKYEDELAMEEKKVKNLKKDQKDRYKKLLEFMGVNRLEEVELDKGRIKYEKYKTKGSMSNKVLIDLLKGYHKEDSEKAMDCFTYINNRPKLEKERLKIKKFT
tara:strand:- start:204 stop:629 length:426 start_codon:yes stop_codon:yes gene_type:complete